MCNAFEHGAHHMAAFGPPSETEQSSAGAVVPIGCTKPQ